MKKILDFFKVYKLDNYITIFGLIGMKELREKSEQEIETKKDLIDFIVFVSILIFSLFLAILFKSPNLFLLSLLILIVVYFYIINEEYNFSTRYLNKYFKKRLKKDLKVNIKDKKFRKFIIDNYEYLKEINLSKKEVIKLLNNWKESESEIEKDKKIYERNKREKELKNLQDKIEKLENKIKELK